ncbi:MAG: hypothetical protein V3W19_14710 [Desulfatiglandales bacterium]
MTTINQFLRYSTGILFLLAAVVSCATVSDLKVTYRLPPKSDELKGKKVFLGFQDARASKDILGEGAKREFKGFSGNILFSLVRDEGEGFRIGIYDVPSFFREVFKRRLENLGAEVLPKRKEGEIELVIVLNDFLLDLVSREWVATIDYEAKLVKGEEDLGTQLISGKAERFKWVGRGQADVVMGDIFSDMINRLDVVRLFKQANLL